LIFKVNILGCGSATPTLRRNPTAQVVNVLERHFLIDCAEGTQLQMRKYGIKFQKINHIFISHLHGDHYLGLIGFISTLHLLGRTKELHLYGPEPLGEIIFSQLRASKSYLSFHIEFHPLTSKESELIYEDEKVTIETIPLKHRIYCNGFLIKEKQHDYRIDIKAVQAHNVPIAWYQHLKKGKDYELENTKIPVSELTFPPYQRRSYAYCSDTAYLESIIPIIENTHLLYHEATFLSDQKDRAKQTMHSTIEEACLIAQKAKVKQLLVGHYSARYKTTEKFIEEATPLFKNTIAVEDGDEFTIPLK
jgi:ribonuclease Z